MVRALLAFLKKPATIIGFLTALLFQIIFPVIWLTAYDHVTDHVDKLPIAIVNEDQGPVGKTIAEKLTQLKTFQITSEKSLQQSMDALEIRKYRMIIEIPADFTSTVQQPNQKAQFIFHINESNPTMVKSFMQSIANELEKNINQDSIQSSLLSSFLQAKIAPNQAEEMAKQLANRVEMKIDKKYPVSNFASLMIPMMMILACYAGSMMMAMQMEKVSGELKHQFSKWDRYIARIIINLVAAVFISTAGTVIVYVMSDHVQTGFFQLLLFQMVSLLAFMFVAKVPLLILGDAGAWVNIALLSLQLVSSGALLPREIMSEFYVQVGTILPATYAVEGIMNNVLGGISTGNDLLSLLWISLVSIVMGAIAVGIKREFTQKTNTIPSLSE